MNTVNIPPISFPEAEAAGFDRGRAGNAPKCIVLDEPTAMLDPTAAKRSSGRARLNLSGNE